MLVKGVVLIHACARKPLSPVLAAIRLIASFVQGTLVALRAAFRRGGELVGVVLECSSL